MVPVIQSSMKPLQVVCLKEFCYLSVEGKMSVSESESESEWDLLPSRFTPTWNFFWCEGAYSKHKT